MHPVLKLGSTGESVRMLQAALRALGHYATPWQIDGYFGQRTDIAVRGFQSTRGLVVDGIVGPVTWATIEEYQRAPFPPARCWPLRCLPDGRKPIITSGHRERNPERPKHYGVDMFYRYRHSDPTMMIGDGGREENWWIPDNTYAIAPFTGRVVLAGDSDTGKRVWLAHPSGWNAGFFHLDELVVAEGAAVELGSRIGRVSHNPSGGADPKHLHFEVYWGEVVDDVRHKHYPRGTVDPQLMLDVGSPYLPALPAIPRLH